MNKTLTLTNKLTTLASQFRPDYFLSGNGLSLKMAYCRRIHDKQITAMGVVSVSPGDVPHLLLYLSSVHMHPTVQI